jgi:hypothetical protein
MLFYGINETLPGLDDQDSHGAHGSAVYSEYRLPYKAMLHLPNSSYIQFSIYWGECQVFWTSGFTIP